MVTVIQRQLIQYLILLEYRGYCENAANLGKELSKSAKKLHESLYGQKHAFYFRKMGECCDVLEVRN